MVLQRCNTRDLVQEHTNQCDNKEKSLRQVLIDTYNLPDAGTGSESDSFAVLDNAFALALDPATKPSVRNPVRPPRRQARGVTDHLRKLVPLQRPLELAYGREESSRDGERGRFNVRKHM